MTPAASGPRRVRDVMTLAPVCAVPSTSLSEIAALLTRHDCGAIPIVENRDTGRPVGVVTDRDIVCRTVAEGRNPLELTAADCMSAPCIVVAEEMEVAECTALMEFHGIRRVVAVNESGAVCGIVAHADLARRAEPRKVAELVRTVSEPPAPDDPALRRVPLPRP
jgi:CBS domain-containing protein